MVLSSAGELWDWSIGIGFKYFNTKSILSEFLGALKWWKWTLSIVASHAIIWDKYITATHNTLPTRFSGFLYNMSSNSDLMAVVSQWGPHWDKKSALTFSVFTGPLDRPLWHFQEILGGQSKQNFSIMSWGGKKPTADCFYLSLPVCPVAAGGSTPPGISAPTVTSIPSPISVNGFTGMPPPQANGQPPAEAVFTNGIHHYPGKSDGFQGPYADPWYNSQRYRENIMHNTVFVM